MNWLGLLISVLCFLIAVPYFGNVNKIFNIVALVIIIILHRRIFIDSLLRVPILISGAFIIFLVAILISSLAVNDYRSIDKALDWWRYSATALLMYMLVLDKRCETSIFYGFLVALGCLSVFGLYEYIDGGCAKRIMSLSKHPNHFASMLDMILPFCIIYFIELIRNKKMANINMTISFFVITLGVVCLFLTGSRGGIIGTSIGLLLSFVICCIKNLNFKSFMKYFTVVSMVTVISLGALFCFNGGKFTRSYDNERLLLIESSYNMWSDNKIFGIGLRNWKTQYQNKYILPEAKERKLTVPHNIFAYYFATTGLVGGIGFCMFLVVILKYLIKNLSIRNEMFFVAFAMIWSFLAINIHGLVDVGITIEKIYRLFCAEVGITVALLETSYKVVNKDQ